MSANVKIVIPARFGSSRLPGKPLLDIAGKPMIQHVYERALGIRGASGVVVATDDERVMAAVEAFGGNAVMTSSDHESGTDRIVEVSRHWPADIFVNVQGDEPLFRAEDVARLIDSIVADESIDVATLYHAISDHEADNPNSVKVVTNALGDALYFSRSPIPYDRDRENIATYKKHIGIYAYRQRVLEGYSDLSQPMLERSEKLEQLRLLHEGYRIRAIEVAESAAGVDTPECLERVRAIFRGETPVDGPSLANVRLVITDVDGVLTTGQLAYGENGEALKMFNARDGLGTSILQNCGVQVAALSGRDSPVLRKRLADLNITLFQLGKKEKRQACQALIQEAGVSPAETLFIGDDTLDLPAFEECALSACPADAADYVRKASNIVLTCKGGEGAFRELADMILKAQGHEDAVATARGYEQLAGNKAQ